MLPSFPFLLMNSVASANVGHLHEAIVMDAGFTSQAVLGCTREAISLDLLFSGVLGLTWESLVGEVVIDATTLQKVSTLW